MTPTDIEAAIAEARGRWAKIRIDVVDAECLFVQSDAASAVLYLDRRTVYTDTSNVSAAGGGTLKATARCVLDNLAAHAREVAAVAECAAWLLERLGGGE